LEYDLQRVTKLVDKDLYGILGVGKGADAQEIKKKYRELARKYHPDRNPSADAEARFKEISAAFAVLGDADKRRNYDEFGVDGLREGFDPDAARNYQRWAGQFGGVGGPGMGPGGGFGGFGDLDDLLGSLFGGGRGGFGGMGGRQRSRQRAPQNIERGVTVSLRQAVEGCEVQLADLGGKVKLPGGVSDGQKIRLAGRGGQGPGGRGDLILKVSLAIPGGYGRDGDDLTVDLPLTVAQACLGGPIEVPTPEGSLVKLNVPAGSQSGQRLRLRHKGAPKKGGGRGHLYARILVRVPVGDSDELSELVQGLEEFY
jgi:DnaJ-class molecular chaperone